MTVFIMGTGYTFTLIYFFFSGDQIAFDTISPEWVRTVTVSPFSHRPYIVPTLTAFRVQSLYSAPYDESLLMEQM